MAGRLTKYRPEYCELAIKFMDKGYSKYALAGKLRVSRDTIYEWCKNYPEFSDCIKRGEARSILFWETKGLEALEGKVKHFPNSLYIFVMKSRFGYRDNPPYKKDPLDELLEQVTTDGVSDKAREDYNVKLARILSKRGLQFLIKRSQAS